MLIILLLLQNLKKAISYHPSIIKFNPIGVSGVVVIAESHFSIHTWPEFGYCAVDIFTCGDKIEMNKALESIKMGFKSDNVSVFEAQRGTLPLPEEQINHEVDA